MVGVALDCGSSYGGDESGSGCPMRVMSMDLDWWGVSLGV